MEKYSAQEFRLLCHDDDEERDHLGKCYDDMGEDKMFEIRVLDLIGFAERRNKFEKLVNLLRHQRGDLDEFVQQSSEPLSSKPTITSYRNINEGAWSSSSKLRAGLTPPSQPETVGDRATRIIENSPQLERIYQDIAHLEQNMNAIGEIDELLGTLDGLLNEMRHKLSSLLVDIKVKHQRLHEERLATLEKPSVVQRSPLAAFESGQAAMSRQQLVSRPGASGRWPQEQYPRTSYGQERMQ
ncbi:MAG: hypothetical protein R3D55_24810 [Chloroflexota bacterium]